MLNPHACCFTILNIWNLNNTDHTRGFQYSSYLYSEHAILRSPTLRCYIQSLAAILTFFTETGRILLYLVPLDSDEKKKTKNLAGTFE